MQDGPSVALVELHLDGNRAVLSHSLPDAAGELPAQVDAGLDLDRAGFREASSQPRLSAGTRPALSRDDLPAPDGAASNSGPLPTRSKTRSTSAAVACSRPKNHSPSSGVNADRPR